MLNQPIANSQLDEAIDDIRTFLKERVNGREFDFHTVKRLDTDDVTVAIGISGDVSRYFLAADRLARAHAELSGWSEVMQSLNDWIERKLASHLSR